MTLKQDVPHDVCLGRTTAVAALVSQQLQWLVINVHDRDTAIINTEFTSAYKIKVNILCN